MIRPYEREQRGDFLSGHKRVVRDDASDIYGLTLTDPGHKLVDLAMESYVARDLIFHIGLMVENLMPANGLVELGDDLEMVRNSMAGGALVNWTGLEAVWGHIGETLRARAEVNDMRFAQALPKMTPDRTTPE